MPENNDINFDQEHIQADYWKQQEQYRAFLSDRYIAASKIYVEQAHTERMKHLEGIIAYGINTVRLLMILNGGAVLSLLTFIGSMYSKGEERNITIASALTHSLMPAFYCFISGLMLTVVTSGTAYVNFLHSSDLWNGPGENFKFIHGEKIPASSSINRRVTAVTAWISVSCAVGGLVLFARGSYLVSIGFLGLGAR